MSSSASSTYLIPHRGLGAVQSVPVVPATGVSFPAGQPGGGTTEVTATLHPNGRGGWRVEAEGAPAKELGHITAEDATQYPELELLVNAGLIPAATLRAGADANAGTPTMSLLLPRPGLCLPANNPPSTPWALLSYAPPLSVTQLEDTPSIDPHARMHLLVTLRATQPEGPVEVALGTESIAVLDSAPSSLHAVLAEHAAQGYTTLAHAYHFLRGGRRVLNIYAGPQESQGSGQEWALTQHAPSSHHAAQTFETSSFRVITDSDLARLDRLPANVEPDAQEHAQEQRSAHFRRPWLMLCVVLVVVAMIAMLTFAL
ncbi:hypothetical protein [Corynebacterium sp.]|uniref:hypothetical protein n=1 Tax=Corynebacterium sp. TaxID=1720 RepID=UPI0026DCE154|nr:hypothetical protein [Corynebacterium sp.]MDO5031832.1 hypothetical protein [Corynebacterium sp.]